MAIEEVIFLGAGASMSEGASSQEHLFRDYFISTAQEGPEEKLKERIIDFFKTFFGIDIPKELKKDSKLEKLPFPTFEEVLGVIEFALNREESFKDYTFIPRDNSLHQIKEDLIFLIALTLKRKLERKNVHHKKLIQRLKNENKILQTAFISLNYDLLIDNALMDCAFDGSNRIFDLNYGVDFTNFQIKSSLADYEWAKPRPKKSINLYKLHGSLNWLYCPTCISLTLTPKEKRVATLVFKPEKCENCKTEMIPIVIPPTFLKVMSNPFLQEIWYKVEAILRQAKRIIFCGYSFPDADIHIKYLLKRVEVNEGDEEEKNEERRYKRFFINKTKVKYLKNETFQKFCENGLAQSLREI